jgi:hypothetical protein
VRGNPRRPSFEECAVTSDLTPHYDRMMLLLDRPLPSRGQALLARGLVRKKVEVVNKPDGRFAFQFNGTALDFRARQRPQSAHYRR